MTNYVKKIDSNVTGLRYCEEDPTQDIGTLPATDEQVWYGTEPNSYADFGAPTKTVARQPINPSRQIRKGVLTDLDPAGGWMNDLTQDGLTRLMQGFFFANIHESFDTQSYNLKNTGFSSVATTSTFKLKDGAQISALAAGYLVWTSGFTSNANNGLFDVASKASANASGVLTSSANYGDGETVTIGTRVYTFQTALTAGDGHVKIAASEALSITNLVNAINNSGGAPGTDYNVSAADPNVTAVGAAHTVTVTAVDVGYGFNSVATTTTAADATWGAADLSGGTADVVVTATSLVADASPVAAARMVAVGVQGTSGDITITNDGSDLPYASSTTLDFTTLPLMPGEWLWVGGDSAGSEFATVDNNGWARIRSIAAHKMVFDKTSNEMVTDAGTGKTVQLFWGKVLKNEADPASQKRRTYTLERSLGNPSLDDPTAPQAEYIGGAVANELTINLGTADKIAFDMTMMACNYFTIDQDSTILSQVDGASAPVLASEDAFNTTSHVSRAKMTVLSATDAAPTSLFAELTELKVMIKNNLKANKAVGKLGPFEITAGFFEGSGSVQAYFNTVDAVQAVRNNADVSIDLALAKSNQGMVFDLPLLTLQSKGLDVKINEPIMLPIDMTMGADRNFDFTASVQFFDYLPDVAMPA